MVNTTLIVHPEIRLDYDFECPPQHQEHGQVLVHRELLVSIIFGRFHTFLVTMLSLC